MDNALLLWSTMLNFRGFMVCLNNLHPSINDIYEKAKVTRDENRNLVQILNFLDANVILNSKNGISTDVYYEDANTHDYLPHDNAHPESCKKNIPYHLAKRIIVFLTNPGKVKLQLNELRIWLKNKYSDHIILMLFTMLNCKILHQNLNIILTIYLLLHPSTKIQIIILY